MIAAGLVASLVAGLATRALPAFFLKGGVCWELV